MCDQQNVEITPEEVAECFRDFLNLLSMFRIQEGLTSGIDNTHESFTGMTDKHARIGRQMKHFMRGDPKADWPQGAGAALMGYMVYVHLLLTRLRQVSGDQDEMMNQFFEGMENELKSMIKQYSE